MAEDNNGDVDRAMAAFAASPMRYFTAAAAAPGEAAPLSGGQPPGRSDPAVAFPLLLAALPGLNQTPMPVPPAGRSDKPRIIAAEAKKTDLLTRQAAALYRPVAQSPEMMTSPQQTERVPNLSAVFGLPVRHDAAPLAGRPVLRPHGASPTPIEAMFHTLHATGPAPNEPAQAQPGLQSIFSRL